MPAASAGMAARSCRGCVSDTRREKGGFVVYTFLDFLDFLSVGEGALAEWRVLEYQTLLSKNL